MAFIPFENGIKAILKQTYLGQQVENVIWFHAGFPADTSMLLDVALGLRTWWNTEMKAFMSQYHTLDSIVTIQMDAVNSPQVVDADPVTGLDTAQSLPGNVALCVTFRSLLRGKSYRGRAYMSGLTEAFLAAADQGNTADATYVLGILDAWAALSVYVPASIPGLPSHVIASHFAAGIPRAFVFASGVVSYDANPQLDSQRRRLAGRGI